MTLSSDRYVLPLKANFKGRMQGIIHDWSQTGETCYFEPMFLVEINNRLQELKHEEREEEQKVLAYLRDLLLAERPGAQAALELLAQLDVLQAKRRLAALFDGQCLTLSPVEEGISLFAARHPLLALARSDAPAAKNAGGSVRPLDILLRPGERALVITGGNAGGKTVCPENSGPDGGHDSQRPARACGQGLASALVQPHGRFYRRRAESGGQRIHFHGPDRPSGQGLEASGRAQPRVAG